MATLGFTDWLSMIGTFSVVMVLLILTLVMLKKMGPNLGNANGKRVLEMKNFDRLEKFDGKLEKFKDWVFDFKVAVGNCSRDCAEAILANS